MPSPLGHALGGLAAGWIVAGVAPAAGATARRRTWPFDLRQAAVFVAAGVAPDLDLLVGSHSTYTHSVGAAAIVFVLARVLAPAAGVRFAIALAAAVASHPLLDWLGTDTTAPIGIMALWPFSQEFYQSDLHVFMAVSRRYRDWQFYTQNIVAALRETAILGPIVAVVGLVRRSHGPGRVADPGP